VAQERQILGYKPDGTPIYGPPLSAPQTRMTVGEPFKANLESLGGPAQPRYKDPLDADRRDQFNAEVPMESSFSSLDFFKSLLDSPGKAVQLGKDALKAKVDYDLGVVDQVASGARSAASAVYDFGRDLKTELPNTTARQGLQALSNFNEGVTGEALADYGEEGKSAIGKIALGAGVLAGMIGGEGEVAGARRIGRGLYSRLDDAFKLIPDKPMHPNAILNLLKKAPGGVSTEEMAYRGVPEFLAGHGEKPVSRAALAAHLEANPAPMPTVKTLGVASADEALTAPELKRLKMLELENAKSPLGAIDDRLGEGTYEELMRLQNIRDNSSVQMLMDKSEELSRKAQRIQRNAPATADRLWAEANHYTARSEAMDLARKGISNPTHHSNYTLPGGENYRETLLQMPAKGLPFDEWVRATQNGREPESFNKAALDVLRKRHAENPVIKDSSNTFSVKSHFGGEENIVTSTRANDRTLPKLGRGRFLEEAQSDWHQKGKAQGYQSNVGVAQLEQQEAQLLESLPALEAARGKTFKEYNAARTAAGNATGVDMQQLPFASRQQTEAWHDAARTLPEDASLQAKVALEDANTRLRDVRRELEQLRAGVPDAPFKDSWPELGLKQQLLKVAEDPKAEWMGWTGGKTQAARYDLSKHLSEVHYSGGNLKAYDHKGKAVIEQTGVSPDGLSEYLGKELAQRLIDQPKQGTLRSLTGLDLKVGGEGMVKFYDEKLVARMNKIVKPFGGVVERVKMGDEFAWIVKVTPEMKKKILASGLPLMAGVAMVDSRKDK